MGDAPSQKIMLSPERKVNEEQLLEIRLWDYSYSQWGNSKQSLYCNHTDAYGVSEASFFPQPIEVTQALTNVLAYESGQMNNARVIRLTGTPMTIKPMPAVVSPASSSEILCSVSGSTSFMHAVLPHFTHA